MKRRALPRWLLVVGMTVFDGMILLIALALTIELYEPVKSCLRWGIFSRSYKQEVASLPNPSDGTLKHLEWDGWGFPGAGKTVMYLVFDPNNTLAISARLGTPEKPAGLPCEIARARKMENQWYIVLFYTDTEWHYCLSHELTPNKSLNTDAPKDGAPVS